MSHDKYKRGGGQLYDKPGLSIKNIVGLIVAKAKYVEFQLQDKNKIIHYYQNWYCCCMYKKH